MVLEQALALMFDYLPAPESIPDIFMVLRQAFAFGLDATVTF